MHITLPDSPIPLLDRAKDALLTSGLLATVGLWALVLAFLVAGTLTLIDVISNGREARIVLLAGMAVEGVACAIGAAALAVGWGPKPPE